MGIALDDLDASKIPADRNNNNIVMGEQRGSVGKKPL